VAALSDRNLVRLLINDRPGDSTDPLWVFSNDEIDAFLTMEGASVKLAAALALETIANDEALTSKVIRSQDLSTDGAAVAAGLRESAARLRQQAGGALAPRGTFPDVSLIWRTTSTTSTLLD
jgi:hypothetical protein